MKTDPIRLDKITFHQKVKKYLAPREKLYPTREIVKGRICSRNKIVLHVWYPFLNAPLYQIDVSLEDVNNSFITAIFNITIFLPIKISMIFIVIFLMLNIFIINYQPILISAIVFPFILMYLIFYLRKRSVLNRIILFLQ